MDYTPLINKCRTDPVWFVEHMLRGYADVWSAEIMNAIADLDRAAMGLPTIHNHTLKTRFTVASGHSRGKTHTICQIILWYMFTRKCRIPCTSPKEAQLVSRTWPTLRKIVAAAHPEFTKFITIDVKRAHMFDDIDWCAIIETASCPENLAGHHEEHLLFIVEEASGVAQNMFPVIEGALSTEGALMLMIGNPTQNTGEFYESHKKASNEALYYRKTIAFNETTQVSQQWVDDMARKYGVNSPIYKIRVLGEFAETSENQLISLSWFRAAIKAPPEHNHEPCMLFSCDVAAGGVDNTVIIRADQYDNHIHIRGMHQFNFDQSIAVAKTREAVANMYDVNNARSENGDYIIIDANGVGDGAGAELILAGYPVIRYKGGAKSDDTEAWRNRRVQSYMCLRDALRDGRITFDDDFCTPDELQEFEDQLSTILLNPGTERVEDLETKERMINRGVKSPDMVDALTMLYATQVPHGNMQGNVETFGGVIDVPIGEAHHFDEEF